MPATWEILDATKTGALRDEKREFALDVLEGLSERPKRLNARWFYDDRGSELFARIMDIPQYYLTDCEREILETHGESMVSRFDGPFDVVDLGAGDGRKTQLLLEPLVRAGVDVRYVPIDISEQAIEVVVNRMGKDLPDLEIHGLVSEYTDGLHWLGAAEQIRPKLVLFLGSNIGNFNKSQARAFLRRLWTVLAADDYVLIGFDLKKDIDLLLSAYNDPTGITSAFNLNLLSRINRELGANFDVEQWRHFGTYNVFSGAMESYLVSLSKQTVGIDALSQEFQFEPWEPIHTEFSYKYLPTDVTDLADSTGFRVVEEYRDRRGWFVDALWGVTKSG